MNISIRHFVSVIIGCLALTSSIPNSYGSDEPITIYFKNKLDNLLSVDPHSTDDLKPAIAFIKAHEKDPDLESEMRQSKYFVKIDDNVRYYFNPDKYGRNTYFSIDDFYIYIFYDSANKEMIEKLSNIRVKKTEQDFEIRSN